MPSFTALAVLFPDCQKLTYVKQQNVALPLVELAGVGFAFKGATLSSFVQFHSSVDNWLSCFPWSLLEPDLLYVISYTLNVAMAVLQTALLLNN